MINFQNLASELKQSHPEKFPPEVLDRTNRIVNRWAWLWRGLMLFVGLWLLFLPDKSLGWLVWLFFGMIFGGFIRSMSSNKMSGWKTAYREMRPAIRFLAWVLVAGFALGILGYALILCGLILHPLAPRNPQEVMMASFATGIPAGWLLVHRLLKQRKNP